MMLAAHRYQVHHRSARTTALAILAAVLAINVVATTLAQEYLTLPLDPNAGKNRAVAQQCLRDPAYYAANKAKFDEYFNNFMFPSMTRTEPDKLGDVGKVRDDLFKYFILKATDPQLQHDLTELTFKSMAKIVGAQNPPCHPAARYNAILILGQLDDSYAAPEKPSLQANKALIAVVDSATTANRFSPAVILGAIIGLERHAQLKDTLPPESVNAMRAALLKLVTHADPIQEMDRDAYSWLRLRAASALARMGSVGEKNAVHDAIVKLAATNKSLDDRCAALALLEKINYKDVKLDDSATLEPIFALARDVAAAEDKRADTFQDQGGGAGGFVPGRSFEPGGVATGGSTYDPNAYPRRQTLARLSSIKTGLTTVKGGISPDGQKKVDAVLAAITPVINAAAGKDTDLTLAQAIHTMTAAINTAIPGPVKAEDKAKDATVF